MTLLTKDMIKEMIPMIGHRAKFKANLKEWRKAIDITNDQVTSILVRTNLKIITYYLKYSRYY